MPSVRQRCGFPRQKRVPICCGIESHNRNEPKMTDQDIAHWTETETKIPIQVNVHWVCVCVQWCETFVGIKHFTEFECVRSDVGYHGAIDCVCLVLQCGEQKRIDDRDRYWEEEKIGVTQTSDVKFITIKYLLDFSMAHRVANTPAATFPSMSTGIWQDTLCAHAHQTLLLYCVHEFRSNWHFSLDAE